jgi:CRP-like cAMP-binding protein
VPAPKFDVFRNLPDETVEKLISTLPSQTYTEGEVLLRENQANDRVFLIESGELDVWKGEPKTAGGVKLVTLKAGSCFGEMSAINGAAATANIVAATAATVRTMGLDDLKHDAAVQKAVTLNLARMLVDRLSNATVSLKSKHESEMAALKVVASASSFLTRILTALSFYMFAMPLILFIKPLLPSDSLISFFFIVAFLWVVLDFMKRSQIKQEYFHMSLQGWPRQVMVGCLWASPFMAAFLLAKMWIAHGSEGAIKVFEPMRIEMKPSTASAWKSILVSDVVFASIHMHLGSMFAFLAFIAGVVFGFMFWRAKSYLAVATAHAVYGVWAIFVIGIPR